MSGWRVPGSAAGSRLDRYLANRLDEPRNRVQRWIRDGQVTVEGERAKPALVLAGGEWIDCRPPPVDSAAPQLEPEPGPLTLLHEDADLVAVDKPPGLAVHPGAGRRSGTLANFLLARYPEMLAAGSPLRPGIVHRLDVGTSGVMVVARSVRAYRALSDAFRHRRVEKRYLALTYGSPRQPTGEIEAAIGRHRSERKRMAVRADGRPALTRYRTVASHPAGIALLELEIHTGRTHQIRVHLKSLGHPVIGDPVYGEARWRSLPGAAQGPLRRFARPALHAWRLGLEHPGTGEWLELEAPVPEDLRRLWRETGGGEFPGVRGVGGD